MLLAPPPRRRPLAVTAVVSLLLASVLAAVAVQHLGEDLFEQAGQPTAIHHS